MRPTDRHAPDVVVERAIKQALLIEDDPGVRDLVELFLGSLGMDVTSCSAEQEVLKLPNYDFDIIVSDVMLASGKTGPDLVRKYSIKTAGHRVLIHLRLQTRGPIQ